MIESPRSAGYRQPGEWTPHRACWLAWPSLPSLWPDLERTQASYVRMCRAIAEPRPGKLGEMLEVLVRDQAAHEQAAQLLAGLRVRFHRLEFGDIWMRDIAPVFLTNTEGRVASVRFRFNGWGGKYTYLGDDEVAEGVQAITPYPRFASALVCEGGGVECDGAGLCLTTREVVLNENRNPGANEREVEELLRHALGSERVIFLDRGLRNDHTDGHIDNIARFIAEGRVVCSRAVERDDPNADTLAEIERALTAARLEVVTIPSPGLVLSRDGEPLPASYLNFYIANESVVVPTFDSAQDEAGLEAIQALFPERVVMGVPAKIFLEEGGTIHCITQQEPRERGSEP